MAELANLDVAEQMPGNVPHNFREVHDDGGGGGGGSGANLLDRLDKLEAKIDSTNKKLDDVLFLLRKRL